ncbi:hypothetical protein NicSoilC12_05030 [Arthrobacter sp. NicSoilC12]|nr:hypothetical protein NicSoilC12_05030 [Arthrobacter sp. NicSoilC12]
MPAGQRPIRIAGRVKPRRLRRRAGRPGEGRSGLARAWKFGGGTVRMRKVRDGTLSVRKIRGGRFRFWKFRFGKFGVGSIRGRPVCGGRAFIGVRSVRVHTSILPVPGAGLYWGTP